MDFLIGLIIAYQVGFFVAAYVMARRSQAVVRRKVLATGHPVSAAYAYSYLAWAILKAFVWPLVLGVWISRGKPEPGSWSSETRPAGKTAN
jgi:hypothetical protein